MPLTEQQQLVFDTLHYQYPNNGSCFVTNQSGLNLITADASFLPTIKDTLLKAAAVHDYQLQRDMDYVIMAFLVIAAKYAPETIDSFIASLPLNFMRAFVRTIPAAFRKLQPDDRYNFGVAPPPKLIAFVSELTRCEDAPMEKIALRALGFLKPQET